jgi:prepilin-type N-terminal cleavage/methylation domain-containing protein
MMKFVLPSSLRSSRRRGFTLIEAMMLMTILSIVALAAGVSLQSLTRVPQKNDDQLKIANALIDKMEQLRGTAFASLTVGSSSDTVTISNTPYTRSWTIALADANGDGTNDSDFKQITVTVNSRSLMCYVVQP